MITSGATTTVTVTAEHIASGTPCSSGRCPVALALIGQGLAPDGSAVVVGVGQVYITTGGNGKEHIIFSAALPSAARQFIDQFDQESPVDPLAFDLTWDAS